MAHSVSPAHTDGAAAADEPSVGSLVQSAMADLSTLVRGEIELAKAEVGKSAKKAGIGAGAFGAAGRRPRLLGLLLRHRLRRVPHLAGPRALDLLPDRLVPPGAARRARRARRQADSQKDREARADARDPARPARGAAPRGARRAAPRRARGQQRPGCSCAATTPTRSDRPAGPDRAERAMTVPEDGPPDATSVLLPGPVDAPHHLRQRHRPARRRGRRGAARPAPARLPAVLVDVARRS